jgi:hypothetical protein
MKKAMSFSDKIHWAKETIPIKGDWPKMITLCNGSGMLTWDSATEDEIKKGVMCKLCRRLAGALLKGH